MTWLDRPTAIARMGVVGVELTQIEKPALVSVGVARPKVKIEVRARTGRNFIFVG